MLILKVFSGQQLGSEIELAKNEIISIGNDYNLSVYIQSISNDIKEISFIINDVDEILFSNISTNINFYNNELIEENKSYQLPCYINFDGTYIAIGDKDMILSWPELEHNDIISMVDDISAESTTRSKLDMFLVEGKNFFLHFYEKYIKSYVSKLRNIYVYLHRNYPKYLYFGILGFILLLIMILYLYSGFKTNQNIALNLAKRDQQIIRLKKNYNNLPIKYSSVHLQSIPSGYLLCGMVQSDNDIKYIKNYFNNYNDLLNYNLFTSIDANNKIKSILADANITNLRIKYDSDTQNINLYGIAMHGLNVVTDAQIKLDNYLPCVDNIDFTHIYDLQQIRQDIDSTVKSTNSYLNIKESLDIGTIYISGFLTNIQSNNLIDSLNKLQDKYKNVVLFKLDIKDALDALPIKIDKISVDGDASYIITDSGQYIYIGGEIGGFKLISISSQKIVFSGKFNLEIPIDAIINNININGNGNSINNVNSFNYKNTHKKLLNEELNILIKSVESEKIQVEKIKRYQEGVNDIDLNNFLSQQIDSLKQDIETKQHEINLYNKGK